jgi:hypothetical protein
VVLSWFPVEAPKVFAFTRRISALGAAANSFAGCVDVLLAAVLSIWCQSSSVKPLHTSQLLGDILQQCHPPSSSSVTGACQSSSSTLCSHNIGIRWTVCCASFFFLVCHRHPQRRTTTASLKVPSVCQRCRPPVSSVPSKNTPTNTDSIQGRTAGPPGLNTQWPCCSVLHTEKV